jgi:tyrosine-protein phosphatase YwqE
MGIFGNLFKGSGNASKADMSAIGTDMHSHLIPGIDDGSNSLETSIELIKGMQALGYKKLITTPHIQGEFYLNTPETILPGLKQVQRELTKQHIDIELQAAAEYLIDDKFEGKYKSGELLTFGRKHLLVEFSYFNEHPRWRDFFFDLQIAGYTIILAHPERYSYFFRDFGKYEEIKDRGVLFQININSLTGYYSGEVKRMAERFIDLGMVDLAGSDLHNMHYLQALQQSAPLKSLRKLIDSGKLKNNTL